MKNTCALRSIAIIVCSIFTFTTVAWSAPDVGGRVLAQGTHVQDRNVCGAYSLIVPEQYADVLARYKGADDYTVVIVQDAHIHYEAQRNVAHLIHSLVKDVTDTDSRRLIVGVEGADGVIDFNAFRAKRDQSNFDAIADYYLREGMLTGAEYAAIVAPEEMTVVGIEDMALYQQNYAAIVNAIPQRQHLVSELQRIRDVLDALRPHIFTQTLAEFEALSSAYRDDEISFFTYCNKMLDIAHEHGLVFGNYPNIALYDEVYALERSINFDAVMTEMGTLVGELVTALDALGRTQDAERLQVLSKEFNDKTVNEADYFRYVKRLADQAQVTFLPYPNVFTYAQYVDRYAQIDKEALRFEVRAFEAQVKDALAETSEAKTLLRLSENLRFIESASNFKVFREEGDELRMRKNEFKAVEYLGFIISMCEKFGIEHNLSLDIAYIDEIIPNVLDFYACGKQRDTVLIQNYLTALEHYTSDGSLAGFGIVIAGGYHTDGFQQYLQEHNVSYVVVSPKVTYVQDGLEDLYYNRLQGSVDPLMMFFNGGISERKFVAGTDVNAQNMALRMLSVFLETARNADVFSETWDVMNTFLTAVQAEDAEVLARFGISFDEDKNLVIGWDNVRMSGIGMRQADIAGALRYVLGQDREVRFVVLDNTPAVSTKVEVTETAVDLAEEGVPENTDVRPATEYEEFVRTILETEFSLSKNEDIEAFRTQYATLLRDAALIKIFDAHKDEDMSEEVKHSFVSGIRNIVLKDMVNSKNEDIDVFLTAYANRKEVQGTDTISLVLKGLSVELTRIDVLQALKARNRSFEFFQDYFKQKNQTASSLDKDEQARIVRGLADILIGQNGEYVAEMLQDLAWGKSVFTDFLRVMPISFSDANSFKESFQNAQGVSQDEVRSLQNEHLYKNDTLIKDCVRLTKENQLLDLYAIVVNNAAVVSSVEQAKVKQSAKDMLNEISAVFHKGKDTDFQATIRAYRYEEEFIDAVKEVFKGGIKGDEEVLFQLLEKEDDVLKGLLGQYVALRENSKDITKSKKSPFKDWDTFREAIKDTKSYRFANFMQKTMDVLSVDGTQERTPALDKIKEFEWVDAEVREKFEQVMYGADSNVRRYMKSIIDSQKERHHDDAVQNAFWQYGKIGEVVLGMKQQMEKLAKEKSQEKRDAINKRIGELLDMVKNIEKQSDTDFESDKICTFSDDMSLARMNILFHLSTSVKGKDRYAFYEGQKAFYNQMLNGNFAQLATAGGKTEGLTLVAAHIIRMNLQRGDQTSVVLKPETLAAVEKFVNGQTGYEMYYKELAALFGVRLMNLSAVFASHKPEELRTALDPVQNSRTVYVVDPEQAGFYGLDLQRMEREDPELARFFAQRIGTVNIDEADRYFASLQQYITSDPSGKANFDEKKEGLIKDVAHYLMDMDDGNERLAVADIADYKGFVASILAEKKAPLYSLIAKDSALMKFFDAYENKQEISDEFKKTLINFINTIDDVKNLYEQMMANKDKKPSTVVQDLFSNIDWNNTKGKTTPEREVNEYNIKRFRKHLIRELTETYFDQKRRFVIEKNLLTEKDGAERAKLVNTLLEDESAVHLIIERDQSNQVSVKMSKGLEKQLKKRFVKSTFRNRDGLLEGALESLVLGYVYEYAADAAGHYSTKNNEVFTVSSHKGDAISNAKDSDKYKLAMLYLKGQEALLTKYFGSGARFDALSGRERISSDKVVGGSTGIIRVLERELTTETDEQNRRSLERQLADAKARFEREFPEFIKLVESKTTDQVAGHEMYAFIQKFYQSNRVEFSDGQFLKNGTILSTAVQDEDGFYAININNPDGDKEFESYPKSIVWVKRAVDGWRVKTASGTSIMQGADDYGMRNDAGTFISDNTLAALEKGAGLDVLSDLTVGLNQEDGRLVIEKKLRIGAASATVGPMGKENTGSEVIALVPSFLSSADILNGGEFSFGNAQRLIAGMKKSIEKVWNNKAKQIMQSLCLSDKSKEEQGEAAGQIAVERALNGGQTVMTFASDKDMLRGIWGQINNCVLANGQKAFVRKSVGDDIAAAEKIQADVSTVRQNLNNLNDEKKTFSPKEKQAFLENAIDDFATNEGLLRIKAWSDYRIAVSRKRIKQELLTIVDNPDTVNEVMAALYENGYVDKDGVLQAKFADLKTADELWVDNDDERKTEMFEMLRRILKEVSYFEYTRSVGEIFALEKMIGDSVQDMDEVTRAQQENKLQEKRALYKERIAAYDAVKESVNVLFETEIASGTKMQLLSHMLAQVSSEADQLKSDMVRDTKTYLESLENPGAGRAYCFDINANTSAEVINEIVKFVSQAGFPGGIVVAPNVENVKQGVSTKTPEFDAYNINDALTSQNAIGIITRMSDFDRTASVGKKKMFFFRTGEKRADGGDEDVYGRMTFDDKGRVKNLQTNRFEDFDANNASAYVERMGYGLSFFKNVKLGLIGKYAGFRVQVPLVSIVDIDGRNANEITQVRARIARDDGNIGYVVYIGTKTKIDETVEHVLNISESFTDVIDMLRTRHREALFRGFSVEGRKVMEYEKYLNDIAIDINDEFLRILKKAHELKKGNTSGDWLNQLTDVEKMTLSAGFNLAYDQVSAPFLHKIGETMRDLLSKRLVKLRDFVNGEPRDEASALRALYKEFALQFKNPEAVAQFNKRVQEKYGIKKGVDVLFDTLFNQLNQEIATKEELVEQLNKACAALSRGAAFSRGEGKRSPQRFKLSGEERKQAKNDVKELEADIKKAQKTKLMLEKYLAGELKSTDGKTPEMILQQYLGESKTFYGAQTREQIVRHAFDMRVMSMDKKMSGAEDAVPHVSVVEMRNEVAKMNVNDVMNNTNKNGSAEDKRLAKQLQQSLSSKDTGKDDFLASVVAAVLDIDEHLKGQIKDVKEFVSELRKTSDSDTFLNQYTFSDISKQAILVAFKGGIDVNTLLSSRGFQVPTTGELNEKGRAYLSVLRKLSFYGAPAPDVPDDDKASRLIIYSKIYGMYFPDDKKKDKGLLSLTNAIFADGATFNIGYAERDMNRIIDAATGFSLEGKAAYTALTTVLQKDFQSDDEVVRSNNEVPFVLTLEKAIAEQRGKAGTSAFKKANSKISSKKGQYRRADVKQQLNQRSAMRVKNKYFLAKVTTAVRQLVSMAWYGVLDFFAKRNLKKQPMTLAKVIAKFGVKSQDDLRMALKLYGHTYETIRKVQAVYAYPKQYGLKEKALYRLTIQQMLALFEQVDALKKEYGTYGGVAQLTEKEIVQFQVGDFIKAEKKRKNSAAVKKTWTFTKKHWPKMLLAVSVMGGLMVSFGIFTLPLIFGAELVPGVMLHAWLIKGVLGTLGISGWLAGMVASLSTTILVSGAMKGLMPKNGMEKMGFMQSIMKPMQSFTHGLKSVFQFIGGAIKKGFVWGRNHLKRTDDGLGVIQTFKKSRSLLKQIQELIEKSEDAALTHSLKALLIELTVRNKILTAEHKKTVQNIITEQQTLIIQNGYKKRIEAMTESIAKTENDVKAIEDAFANDVSDKEAITSFKKQLDEKTTSNEGELSDDARLKELIALLDQVLDKVIAYKNRELAVAKEEGKKILEKEIEVLLQEKNELQERYASSGAEVVTERINVLLDSFVVAVQNIDEKGLQRGKETLTSKMLKLKNELAKEDKKLQGIHIQTAQLSEIEDAYKQKFNAILTLRTTLDQKKPKQSSGRDMASMFGSGMPAELMNMLGGFDQGNKQYPTPTVAEFLDNTEKYQGLLTAQEILQITESYLDVPFVQLIDYAILVTLREKQEVLHDVKLDSAFKIAQAYNAILNEDLTKDERMLDELQQRFRMSEEARSVLAKIVLQDIHDQGVVAEDDPDTTPPDNSGDSEGATATGVALAETVMNDNAGTDATAVAEEETATVTDAGENPAVSTLKKEAIQLFADNKGNNGKGSYEAKVRFIEGVIAEEGMIPQEKQEIIDLLDTIFEDFEFKDVNDLETFLDGGHLQAQEEVNAVIGVDVSLLVGLPDAIIAQNINGLRALAGVSLAYYAPDGFSLPQGFGEKFGISLVPRGYVMTSGTQEGGDVVKRVLLANAAYALFDGGDATVIPVKQDMLLLSDVPLGMIKKGSAEAQKKVEQLTLALVVRRFMGENGREEKDGRVVYTDKMAAIVDSSVAEAMKLGVHQLAA